MSPPLPDALAAVTAADPSPTYAALRAAGPLVHDAALGMWIAARAAAVVEVLESEAVRVRPAASPVPAWLEGSDAGVLFGRLVRQNDGPRHAAVRPATAALGGLVDAARDTAHRCARALLDGDRRALPGFALNMPAHVVGTLLGLPEAELTDTAAAVDAVVRAFAATATPDEVARGSAAARDLTVRIDGAGGDLLASFVRHGTAPHEVMLANAMGLLIQAHQATAGLIGATLLALARAPGDHPLRDVVREAARHDAPVQNTRRFVAQDTVIAGQSLTAGETILVVLASANRDPQVNPEPDRFDPARRAAVCFTFGRGSHGCPGEALAVAIAEGAVAAVVASGMDLTPLAAGGVRYLSSPSCRVLLEVS